MLLSCVVWWCVVLAGWLGPTAAVLSTTNYWPQLTGAARLAGSESDYTSLTLLSPLTILLITTSQLTTLDIAILGTLPPTPTHSQQKQKELRTAWIY